MITCTRIIGFDAGHRVYGHGGKCNYAHGHRYTAHLTARFQEYPSGLNNLGMVVDFGILKDRVGGWIDEYWDHVFICGRNDPLGDTLLSAGQRVFCLGATPTAENMASHLLNVVCPVVLRDTGVKVVHVRLYETPNCYADAYAE